MVIYQININAKSTYNVDPAATVQFAFIKGLLQYGIEITNKYVHEGQYLTLTRERQWLKKVKQFMYFMLVSWHLSI